MEEYLAKMKEYLSMDSELPYEDFNQYFQDYVGYLSKSYEEFDQDTCVKAKFITSILHANSDDRSKRKGPLAKKYRKMSEKSKLWTDALNYRLLKTGMSQQEIDQAHKAVSDVM